MKSVENLLIFFLKGFIINANGCTKLMQIGGVKDMNEQTLEGCTGFNLIAPVSGTAVPLDQVPDPVFSQKIIGDGLAIEPSDGRIVSPVDDLAVNRGDDPAVGRQDRQPC